MKGSVVQDFFDVDELGAIKDDDTATALAFFREGVTTHNPFYAFLNLYKVIAFVHRNNDGKVRGKWISEALPRLTERRAVERLATLQQDGTDAAKYLWEEGRNAIAHSEKGTFVNPDRIGDQERIERDLPVIRAIARLAIEEHFGIHHRLSQKLARPSPIAGFLALLGDGVVDKILAGTDLVNGEITVPATVTVLVRLRADVHAMEGLVVWAIDQFEEGLAVQVRNQEDTFHAAVFINLRTGELEMGHDDMKCRLDPTSRSSIELARRVHDMAWAYMRNGSVEVWDDATDTLLGKSAAYLPVNVILLSALLANAAHD
jgi:hypothetical protein